MHERLRDELESIAEEYEAEIRQKRRRRERLGDEVEQIEEQRDKLLNRIHTLKTALADLRKLMGDDE